MFKRRSRSGENVLGERSAGYCELCAKRGRMLQHFEPRSDDRSQGPDAELTAGGGAVFFRGQQPVGVWGAKRPSAASVPGGERNAANYVRPSAATVQSSE